MDSTDYQILSILQNNARATIKQISQEVNMSPPSVTERIRRMEEQQVILGYHAEVNPLKLSKNLMVFIGVDVKPERYSKFKIYCEQSACIVEHHRIVGGHNALLLACLQNSAELEILIDELKYYGITSTSVILSTVFKNKPYE